MSALVCLTHGDHRDARSGRHQVEPESKRAVHAGDDASERASFDESFTDRLASMANQTSIAAMVRYGGHREGSVTSRLQIAYFSDHVTCTVTVSACSPASAGTASAIAMQAPECNGRGPAMTMFSEIVITRSTWAPAAVA